MRYKIIQILILFFLFTNSISAQVQYSFFVAGHTYGTPGVNNEGLHPPFKEKFPYIQSRDEIVFGVLTGDIVVNPSAEDWDEVDADIEELGLPVYFAVGNHDMRDRPLFEERYGDTYYNFIYENDLFIVLDPCIDHWNISGEQLLFLQNVVSENSQSVDNIFVFFHQELWWEADNKYKDIIPNSFYNRADEINFWTEIEPLFNNLNNNVVMYAGDFGAVSWSDDVMYDNYDNITFIGSGMGEGAYNGDNFVITNINADKSITYDLICLNENFDCLGELIDFEIPTGISYDTKNINNEVLIYPIPTNKFITVDFNDINFISLKLIIYNLMGQVNIISEYNFINDNKVQINTSDLSEGIYFLHIIINEKNYQIKKIIIQDGIQ